MSAQLLTFSHITAFDIHTLSRNDSFSFHVKARRTIKKTSNAKVAHGKIQWDNALSFDLQGPATLEMHIVHNSDIIMRTEKVMTEDLFVVEAGPVRLGLYGARPGVGIAIGKIVFNVGLYGLKEPTTPNQDTATFHVAPPLSPIILRISKIMCPEYSPKTSLTRPQYQIRMRVGKEVQDTTVSNGAAWDEVFIFNVHPLANLQLQAQVVRPHMARHDTVYGRTGRISTDDLLTSDLHQSSIMNFNVYSEQPGRSIIGELKFRCDRYTLEAFRVASTGIPTLKISNLTVKGLLDPSRLTHTRFYAHVKVGNVIEETAAVAMNPKHEIQWSDGLEFDLDRSRKVEIQLFERGALHPGGKCIMKTDKVRVVENLDSNIPGPVRIKRRLLGMGQGIALGEIEFDMESYNMHS
ncbi:hypothetical protein BV22DRAFT_1132488 [Leucogyrophana mollusca]|uniref:Uncharacterized protein n=1 Tax=Leucogyrophana mollusca TaxID=85980 RepID=A0ACB8B8E7_9AGAM|nr:hypothetical protein BV22DRAFT_1132488 [Leucogyrophana mollusca]